MGNAGTFSTVLCSESEANGSRKYEISEFEISFSFYRYLLIDIRAQSSSATDSENYEYR